MNMNSDDVLPICYRCDKKYKFFLINSVKSILKHYTGSRKIFVYVCTNDDITLDELIPLKEQYNFDFKLVQIDSDFINSAKLAGPLANLALRKFFGFASHDTESLSYNNTTYQFNPFNRSKTVIILWLFFVLTSTYKKIICLDTDTIVVTCIDKLYDTNVDNVSIATCLDWVEPDIINPSVAVVNIPRFSSTFYKDGVSRIAALLTQQLPREAPFCETIQHIVSDMYKNDCLILDRSWNMPITHTEDGQPAKIYHFSESWVGNEKVLTAYDRIISKYL